jgi:multiple sugar transport system permease protein
LNPQVLVVVGVVSQLLLGLGAALLLNRPWKHIWAARLIVMLPWFLPPIAAAYMFAFMIDPRYGVLTRLLGLVGINIGGQGILADPSLALWGVLLVELWRSYPFFALFLLAGLQGIPGELAEAAAVDAVRARSGTSGRWLAAATTDRGGLDPTGGDSAGELTDVDLAAHHGGPGDATQMLSLYAYQQAYQRFDFGYASAIAVALLVVVVGFASVYIRVNSTKES